MVSRNDARNERNECRISIWKRLREERCDVAISCKLLHRKPKKILRELS